ncbi:MAG: DNA polymerase III subunit gamma/tau [Erysipelotrichaceae bacterium]|nr:DNA polymerase III subunit gamma/tau [Erysipelotrichaceae bacterium]
MAYKALYRKYRPSTFEEVVGQQHIVATLQNAIKNNKLAHAYLFCGPRGTGKTSVAKLLAKTINCTSDGNRPCGKCANCIDIQESTHPDVIELDAATNNGVDEVRELIDKVKYAPMQGKYKVYIIDEVHMMTASAFNALLKTLEEPPEYCIFILATTEPHKVLPTIVSRCQRFDFNKVPTPLIKDRLSYIAEKEGIKCEDAALQLVSEIAEGGMRDALSIMDQCIAYAQNDIKASDVSAVYGIATTREKLDLLAYVSDRDTKSLMEKAKSLSNRGIDLQRLTTDLINICKETVVYSYSQDSSILTVLTPNQAEELGKMFTVKQLLGSIDYLMDVSVKYKDVTDSLSYFEVCLLKMVSLISGDPVVETRKQPEIVRKPVETAEIKPVTEEIKAVKPAEPVIKHLNNDQLYMILLRSKKDIRARDSVKWPEVIKDVPELKECAVMSSSETDMIVVAPSREQADIINEENKQNEIRNVLLQRLGTEKNLTAITKDQQYLLISYFKDKTGPIPVIKEEPKKPLINETEEKLIKMFGREGFKKLED